jgi:hypothetical protein
MTRLLVLIAALAALAPLSAWGDVVSETPDKVSVVVYPNLNAYQGRSLYDGLAMVTETRTVDLLAGHSKISFRGVAEGIVAQTVAVQGLPNPVAEQNFDYQLLSPASLLRQAQGQTVRLVRTLPGKGGKVFEEQAQVISSANGVLLDIQGKIEALKCGAVPERIVFDGLPAGFTDKPTLSLETTARAAGRHVLTLSYLATGLSWQANYVARFNADGRTLDLISWITIDNHSATGFPQAPIQVLAGNLQRSNDTHPVRQPVVRANPNCWTIKSGRRSELNLRQLGSGRVDMSEVITTGSYMLAPPPPPPAIRVAPPPRPEVKPEDLGDYKLYTLPEPTTLAAFQTKQLLMFDRPSVAFDKAYRRRMRHGAGSSPKMQDDADDNADLMVEIKNTKASGLGLSLPGGKAALFQTDPASGAQRIAQDSLQNTAINLPVEFDMGAATEVRAHARVVSATHTGVRNDSRDQSQIEVVMTNATGAPVRFEIREDGSAPNFRVVSASLPSTPVKGGPQWLVDVPAHADAVLTYGLEWRGSTYVR